MSVEDLKSQLEAEKEEFKRRKQEIREQMERELEIEKARKRFAVDRRMVLRSLADSIKSRAVEFKALKASEQDESSFIQDVRATIDEADEMIAKLAERADLNERPTEQSV